jgi:hypothetical protein
MGLRNKLTLGVGSDTSEVKIGKIITNGQSCFLYPLTNIALKINRRDNCFKWYYMLCSLGIL